MTQKVEMKDVVMTSEEGEETLVVHNVSRSALRTIEKIIDLYENNDSGRVVLTFGAGTMCIQKVSDLFDNRGKKVK